MQGNDSFFPWAHGTDRLWGPLSWDWQQEGPPTCTWKTVRCGSWQDDRRYNLYFIVWLWDHVDPCVHLLTCSRMHHCCMVSFAHSVHVSRWILADFLEKEYWQLATVALWHSWGVTHTGARSLEVAPSLRQDVLYCQISLWTIHLSSE